MTRNTGLKRGSLSAEEDEVRRHQRRKFVACVVHPFINALYQANPSGIVVSDATHIRSSALAISRVVNVVLLVQMNVPTLLGIARSKLARSM